MPREKFEPGRKYKVLNLTLGEYVVLPSQLNQRSGVWVFDTSIGEINTPRKLINLWNQGVSCTRLANNIHSPCTLSEFEFIELTQEEIDEMQIHNNCLGIPTYMLKEK